ncbi:MAG: hypothetical protein JRI68_12200 [Deltaproteobacteria bacterium]|nr:hypothetical protein [Deltaproteobacteria bacterium]
MKGYFCGLVLLAAWSCGGKVVVDDVRGPATTTSSSTSSSSTSSSSASSSSSTRTSSSSTSGDPCASTPAPAQCLNAHGYEGCCANNHVYWWEMGQMTETDCGAEGSFCGWNAQQSAHWCNDMATGPDPAFPNDRCCSGTNPYGGCN